MNRRQEIKYLRKEVEYYKEQVVDLHKLNTRYIEQISQHRHHKAMNRRLLDQLTEQLDLVKQLKQEINVLKEKHDKLHGLVYGYDRGA